MTLPFLNKAQGGRPSLARVPAITVLKRLGLTNGLKLCLDAGDAASYTSGQSWLDRSGNGHDFFLGADGAATATDPTFTGTPGGLSSGEYFAHDGGDYFTYDTANEAWMDNIHKDNAIFTLMMWVYLASVTSARISGTASATTGVGYMWGTTAGGLLNQSIFTGLGTAAAFNGSAVPVNTWALLGWSHNEAVGANGAISFVSGVSTLATATYTTPSAAAATSIMKIGARGDGAAPLANGGRTGEAFVWEGVSLTSPQMMSVLNAMRGRYGV